MRDDERCGRSKEVNAPELIGQRVRFSVGLFSGTVVVICNGIVNAGSIPS